MPGKVLILDDEIEMCHLLADQLRHRGFEIDTSLSLQQGRLRLEEADFDAVVADLHLADGNGLDLCASLSQERPDLPVIIITAFGNMEAAIGAIRAGAYDFVTKPFPIDALEVALNRAVSQTALRREVRRLRRALGETKRFHGLLGESPPMRELFELIGRVADSDASVLISGESGTGKEVVARAIHASGHRAAGPFIALNCAAVPENLLESELFGYTRGAFTDARQDRAGLFTQAGGGTLFLDEIDELGLSMQPKLLRALQERKVRPLGSAAEVSFDVRLIAATNRDLEEEVHRGRFREDLFFRVQVVHLEMPALRARGNDILLLARHFLEIQNARAGKSVKGITAAAAGKLLEYPWPGNVRELQNCIERGVALTLADELGVEDLPDRIRGYAPAAPRPAVVMAPARLETVEKEHILRILESVGGNKTRAARVLGLDRKTLYRKLEAYGLSHPSLS